MLVYEQSRCKVMGLWNGEEGGEGYTDCQVEWFGYATVYARAQALMLGSRT